MGAPKGNQFWKLRSKHGRDKLFATSKLLWDAACEYFQWCDENPWLKSEQGKKPPKPFKLENDEIIIIPDVVQIPTSRPYTMTGLCLYLGCNVQYFNQFKKSLDKNENDFSVVITRIEEIVYTQKFEGAAVGAFNANIISRDLGLIEKTDNKNTNLNSKELTKDEMIEFNNILENEY